MAKSLPSDLRPFRAVTADFFETANFRGRASVRIAATPERVFEVLEDAQAWTEWAPVLTDVSWTSPKPFGQGTTRDVWIVDRFLVREVFFIWDPGVRLAFHATECNLPNMDAMGEDYQIRELGGGELELTWTIASASTGFQSKLGFITGPLTGFVQGRWLQALKAKCEAG